MIEELNRALTAYQAKWQPLVEARNNKHFFENLKPVSIGWKVTDRVEYDRLYIELHDRCDRIVETWMNGRWVAKMILRDTELNGGIKIIKLMQRRPGSTDAVGLDHVDFYSPEVKQAKEILAHEPHLRWSEENNDVIDNYHWISIWFDGTEAKLKYSTVIDIVIAELEEINKRVKGEVS